MERAGDAVAADPSAHTQMGAEVRAVGIEHPGRPVVTNDAVRRKHYGTQRIPNLLKPKAATQQPANQLLAFFPRPLAIVEILGHLTKLQGVRPRRLHDF